MGEWVNVATGEVATACPLCAGTQAEAEAQVHALELDLRRYRAQVTRLKNEAEAAKVAKRDGAIWQEILRCWLLAFPNKRPSATSVKSARATAVFQRLESGANVEDVKDAIAGAMKLPYMHYGHRAEHGDVLADDIQEIMHIGKDAEFDRLRDLGAKIRGRGE